MQAVIALVLVGVFAFWLVTVWRVKKRKQALLIIKAQSKQETIPAVEQAFAATIAQLNMEKGVLSSLYQSQDVAKVWGARVLAFEFECEVSPDFEIQLTQFSELLEAQLKTQKVAVPDFRSFALTDIWLRDGRLHFDVAENKNEDTAAYIRDVKRVD